MSIHPFSPTGRVQALDSMKKENFDLLIIGGGITGSGIARDAILRGLNVALIEKEDFGYGTSSRSSKLVHGGVRYLETGNIGLVKESATERKVLKHIAPHLIHPLNFIIPVFQGDSLIKYRVGFILFDRLAKSTKKEKHKKLSATEVKEHLPHLRGPVKSGLIYGEYITEDARFTVMNARSAAEHGAKIANHVKATGFRFNNHDSVIGITANDTLTGDTFKIDAKITINATGPWAENILIKNNLSAPESLLLSKGIHLVFPAEKLAVTDAVLLNTPDGKSGFAIRRWDFVYVGTTDIIYEEGIDQPESDEQAIQHLLELVKVSFPSAHIEKEDIIGTWAGLRPLIKQKGKSTRDTPRDDEIWKIKEGLFTIAGGKLTTYRKMADRVLKKVSKDMPYKLNDNSRTKEVILPGGDIDEDYDNYKKEMTSKFKQLGLTSKTIERLVWLYGSANLELINYGKKDVKWLEELAPGIPAIKGEVKLAVEKEMALTLTDFIDRRSSLLLFEDEHGQKAINEIAMIMSNLLGWDELEKESQIISHTKNARKVIVNQ
ncbi:MAG TPA: glycerol-3-phosphate dehydrogenase/oxidase [Pseudogracilibacillus sp.]|nr:glycerol-3-phosphate dehydrogenase/oxidase [Pseudogracilibacillus sp.]